MKKQLLGKYSVAKILAFMGLLTLSSVLYAAQFLANISVNTIELGQSIELSLTLKEASAKGTPDLSGLSQDFSIHSQQQYSTFSSVNGSVTSEAGWDLVLLPTRQGDIVIPSLTINSNKGLLTTQPIKIQVVAPGSIRASNNVKNANTQSSITPQVNADNIGVSLVATINKTRAYVKEPIVYTLKIISFKPINNVALEDIKAADAIIDKVGQPKQYEQMIGGVRAHIIEFKYYITPLVAGKINIKPALIRGDIYVPPTTISRNSHFGMFNNFFMDDVMQFKPFSVRGDQITLTAQAPVAPAKSWLPLQNLQLTEEWTGLDDLRVGSTISRKIKIVATGGFSNQLPSIKHLIEINGVKTYADSPSFKDDVLPNTETIVGTKEENFSIVTVQAGKITFPAIKINWWNLNTKQSESATLPAKTINVLPALASSNNDATIDFAASAPAAAKNLDPAKIKELFNQDNLLYALIAGLLVLVIVLIAALSYLLLRKHTRRTDTNINRLVEVPRTKKQQILINNIKTAEDVRKIIMMHAAEFWQAPDNLMLNKLGTYLTDNNFNYDLEVYILLCREINSEIYATGDVDLHVILDAWNVFKQSVVKNKKLDVISNTSDFINLNPT